MINNEELKQYNTDGNVLTKIHIIGNIEIVEFTKMEDNTNYFRPFIDGKRQLFIYNTLDQAVINALAIKYDGVNSQAGILFVRALNIR